MVRSVLVPLDRSSFAEQALPLALSIARRAGAKLDLVQVHELYALEGAARDPAPFDPELDAEYRHGEELYVSATADWVTAASPVPVSTAVLPGSAVLPEIVAHGLLERARENQADLIVVASHGLGPVRRFFLGSVADELVRRAAVPVLLVRPTGAGSDLIPEPHLENLLIPLDGSALAEGILGPALDLACLMEACCTLLRVVEPGRAAGGPSGRSLRDAETYLEHMAGKLRERRLRVEVKAVAARNPAGAILAEAGARANGLVALATHGRGGFRRLLLGSTADRVIRAASTPVLVYRPGGGVGS